MSSRRITIAKLSRHPDLPPTHPGEILREDIIPATGLSKTEIARLLGLSRQALHDILGEKQGVTPGVAARLGKLIGNGAGFWLRLQQAYDLWHVEREMASELAAIPTLSAA